METSASGREDSEMFCTQCGNEIQQHAQFCSKCGQAAAAAAPPASTSAVPQRKPHDMDMHINILGWLLVGSGILTGLLALMVLFAGQIVRHAPIPWPPDAPVRLPLFIGWLTSVVGLGAMALAAGVSAAGVGLLQYRSWARVLAIIMAVLLLFHFPIGTMIAIYAFWVLFSREGQEYYNNRSASTMTMSGT
jgi:hypothetical protein